MTTMRAALDERFSDPGTQALPWADVEDVLTSAELFWVTTVRADDRPQTPLVAVWLDGCLPDGRLGGRTPTPTRCRHRTQRAQDVPLDAFDARPAWMTRPVPDGGRPRISRTPGRSGLCGEGHAPAAACGHVVRTQLIQRLTAHPEVPVVAIAAPAGTARRPCCGSGRNGALL